MRRSFCYTKKIIVDNVDSLKEINQIARTDKIIGYIFSYKNINNTQVKAIVLDLYISKISENGLSLSNIIEDYYRFCKEFNSNNVVSLKIFKNPEIDDWIATKNNWCKCIARNLSKKYHLDFDDVLSDIYYQILELYNKKNVYMGNLKYIMKSIENMIYKNFYSNRNKITLDNSNVKSLYTILNVNSDGKIQTYEDIIGQEDNYYKESEFNDRLKEIRSSLSVVLSEREIDQIFDCKGTGYLPKSTYNKLLKWRETHKYKDFL